MKRTIALILAVAMTLALLPVSAFAAGGELKPEKTQVSVNIGDTVKPASFGSISYVVDGTDLGNVAGSCTLGGKSSIKYTYPVSILSSSRISRAQASRFRRRWNSRSPFSQRRIPWQSQSPRA